jgi:hypothetical protein
MTELLTESFCERCGNRYELGTSEPMTTKQKTRGLVTGLRQFIMSQDSLQDSLTDAMRAEEETLAARQIDAFQETFNFCLDCRRYTCMSCWNDDAGRCRSCMPVAGIDDVAGFDERMASPALMPAVDETPLLTSAGEPAWPAEEELPAPALAWPSADEIPPAVAAEGSEPASEEPELEVEIEAPEPLVVPGFAAEEPELEVAAEAAAEAEVEVEVEAPEPVVVPGFAAEPELAEEPIEEPIAAAAELEPEAPEPTPVEPPVSAPRRDLRDTFLRGPLVPRQAPSAEPVPESLAARRSQMDALGLDDHGEGTVPVGQRDALPYRSSGAGSAAGSAALAAVWDASTRALEAGAGPQRASLRPCGACGLIVSSTARFCRRCGAPQSLSA